MSHTSIQLFYVPELERVYLFTPERTAIKDDLRYVSCTYCPKYKQYYLLCDYTIIRSAVIKLKELGYNVTVSAEVNALMKELKRKAEAGDTEIQDYASDYWFPRCPFKHQIITFNKALSRNNLLLCLDMGLGKTYTSLSIAGWRFIHGKVSKLLIICPNHLKYNWEDEIRLSLPHLNLKVAVVEGTSKQRQKVLQQKADIVIANIENARLKQIKEMLVKYKFDMLIVDEIHTCRNPDSQQSKGMYEIARSIKYRLGLTGTPISGKDITGYFGIFRIVDLSVFALSSYTAFKHYYCITSNLRGFDEIIEYKNMDEFYSRIAPASIFFKIDEVLDMPGKVHTNTLIKMSDADFKAYKEFERKQFLEFLSEEGSGVVESQSALVKLLRLRQLTSGFVLDSDDKLIKRLHRYKLDTLSQMLQTEYSGVKTIIACNFIQEILDIAELCGKLKIGFRLIYGAIDNKQRHENIMAFRDDPTVEILVCMMSTMIGFNADVSHDMIIFSQNYSFDKFDQCCARMYRPSQKHECRYNHLIVMNTIDGIIQDIVRDKADFSDAVTKKIRSLINN